MRKEINNSDKRSLPQSLILRDIFNGEIDTPDMLKDFLRHVIYLYDTRKREPSIKRRRIDSIAQDVRRDGKTFETNRYGIGF